MIWGVWDMVKIANTYVSLLITVCCLILWPLTAEAQKTAWEKYQRAGVEAYKQGRYAEAEQQFTLALEEAERLGFPDQRLTVTLTSLAMLYSAQNQPDKAEPLYQRILTIREKTLGPEHLEVAACLDNLAEVYEAQGQYTRAEPFYQRALTIREKALKPTHPGIASSLDNLAGIYEQFGRKFLVGMAATTPAASAWDLLKSAEAFDKDNVFRQDIESRLGQIATKAALGFVGAKNYFKALQAVKLAEQSGATASTRIVRDKIEEFAGELYSQAVAEIDVKPKEAKAKLQQIKGLVDAKNPWAVKATKLLDAP